MLLPTLEQQRRNPVEWAVHVFKADSRVGYEGMFVLAHFLKGVS